MFVHLHTHSHYSLLDGLGKIDELLDRAKELGMTAMALTDHGNMYGAVEFSVAAKERGIKPIIGCEMYLAPNGMKNMTTAPQDRVRNHIILLVKNETGYKNLMRLVTLANLEGFYYKPRIDKDLLRIHHEGLIALSGCAQGEIAQAVVNGDKEKARDLTLEYRDIFGEGNFYLELQDHPHFEKQHIINEGLIQLSRETGVGVVATGDIHYIKKEDSPVQDILLCIQTNRKVYEKDRMNLSDFDLSLRTGEEMAQAFAHIPEAITNTEKIAEACNFSISLGETKLPSYPLPEGKTADETLRELSEEGLVKRFDGVVTDEQRARMEYELDIIRTTGYASYFLIVQDFINWAKEQGIVVGPGRGSAAGSFVSYLVGITNIDPIGYNLLFERFLNPERVSMPDVDTDFADDRRDEVLEYCRNKYGADHVAQIITFGTMAARAAIRDAGRALGLSYGFCDQTAKLIPMFSSISDALENVKEFQEIYKTNEDAKRLINSAKRLEGVCRHASVHACGVVITPKPVAEYTPLQRVSGHGDGFVTQYSSSTKTSFVEKIGLLKMDFLGLKNLTIIQNTLRIIKKLHNADIDIETIPLDDGATYELLQAGRTTGIFQLESSGMKRYLKQLKPTVLEDVIAMVALYRPGPMEWIPDFIAGKHGTKQVKYLHPKLEPILSATYGVAVYQEQVMQIARDLAGFTMGEADVLRKAMGKKILALIKEQRKKFIEGCQQTGVGKKIGEQVFAFIEPFAGYGFNRSHAACYAMIGYQTAYLKAHYGAEFMAALLTSDQDNSDRVAIEIAECKEMGISVLPPNINESFEEFAVIGKKKEREKEKAPEAPKSQVSTLNSVIRFGLNAVKNVGKPVARAIVEERKKNGKFRTLAEFLDRVESKDLNKKSIEALAKVGSMDDIGERNRIVENMDAILQFAKSLSEHKNTNQTSLFGGEMLAPPTITLSDAPEATKKERLAWEKELLGLYVSDHPTAEYADYLGAVSHPLGAFSPEIAGKEVSIGGIVQAVKKIFLKNQKTMAFVTVENTTGAIECIVFPKTLERTEGLWSEDAFIIADGKISDKDGQYKLLVDNAALINEQTIENWKRSEATRKKYSAGADGARGSEKFTIVMPPAATQESLQKLSDYLGASTRGGATVFLEVGEKCIRTSFSIEPHSALSNDIVSIIPGAKILF